MCNQALLHSKTNALLERGNFHASKIRMCECEQRKDQLFEVKSSPNRRMELDLGANNFGLNYVPNPEMLALFFVWNCEGY